MAIIEGTPEDWKKAKERHFFQTGGIPTNWDQVTLQAAQEEERRKAEQARIGEIETQETTWRTLQFQRRAVSRGQAALKLIRGKVSKELFTGVEEWLDRAEPSTQFNDMSIEEQNAERALYFARLVDYHHATEKEQKAFGAITEPSFWGGVRVGAAQALGSAARTLGAYDTKGHPWYPASERAPIHYIIEALEGKETFRPPSTFGVLVGHTLGSLPEMMTVLKGVGKLMQPATRRIVTRAGVRSTKKSIAKGLGRSATAEAAEKAKTKAMAYSRGLTTGLGFSALDADAFVRGEANVLDLATSFLIGFAGGYPEAAMLKIASAGVVAGAAASLDEQQAWITGVPFIDAGVTTAAMFGMFHMFGGKENIQRTAYSAKTATKRWLNHLGVKGMDPDAMKPGAPWGSAASLDPKLLKQIAETRQAEQLWTLLHGMHKTVKSVDIAVKNVDRRFLPMVQELRAQELRVRELLQTAKKGFDDPKVYDAINKFTEMVQIMEDNVLQKREPIKNYLDWEEISLNEKGMRHLETTKGSPNTREVLLKLLTRPIRVQPTVWEMFDDQIAMVKGDKRLSSHMRKTKLRMIEEDRLSYLAKQAVGIYDSTFTYEDLQILNVASEKAPEFMKVIQDMDVLSVPGKIKKAPKEYAPGYRRSIHDVTAEVMESGLSPESKQKILNNVQKTFITHEQKAGKTIQMPGHRENVRVNKAELQALASQAKSAEELYSIYKNKTLPAEQQKEYYDRAREAARLIPQDLRLAYLSEGMLTELGLMEPQSLGTDYKTLEDLPGRLYADTGAQAPGKPMSTMEMAQLMMEKKVLGSYDEHTGRIIMDGGQFVGGVWKPKQKSITIQELRELPSEGDTFHSGRTLSGHPSEADMRRVVIYNKAGAKTAVVFSTKGAKIEQNIIHGSRTVHDYTLELYDLTTPHFVRKIAPRRLTIEESKALFYSKTGLTLRVEEGAGELYSYWHHNQQKILTKAGLEDLLWKGGEPPITEGAVKDLLGIEVEPNAKSFDPKVLHEVVTDAPGSMWTDKATWSKAILKRVGAPEGAAERKSFRAAQRQLGEKLSLAGIKKASPEADATRKTKVALAREATKKRDAEIVKMKIVAEKIAKGEKPSIEDMWDVEPIDAEMKKIGKKEMADWVLKEAAKKPTGVKFKDLPMRTPQEKLAEEIKLQKAADRAEEVARNAYAKELGEIRAEEERVEAEAKRPSHAGEGGWSPEAISRAKGTEFFLYDTNTKKSIPIVGIDAVDVPPGRTQMKFQRNLSTGEITFLGKGEKVSVTPQQTKAIKETLRGKEPAVITKPTGGKKLGFLGTQAFDKNMESAVTEVTKTLEHLGPEFKGLTNEARSWFQKFIPAKSVLGRAQQITKIGFWDTYNRMETEALFTIREFQGRLLPQLMKVAKGVRSTAKEDGIWQFLQTEDVTMRAKIIKQHLMQTKDIKLAHQLETIFREAFGEHWVEFTSDYIPHARVGELSETIRPWVEKFGFDPQQTDLFHLANNAIHAKMRRHVRPYLEEFDRQLVKLDDKAKTGEVNESTYKHVHRDVTHYKGRVESSLKHDSITVTKTIENLNEILKFLPGSKGRGMKGSVESNVVSTYLLLTYSGTMPGRVGLCIRNAIQPIKTTYLYMGARNMRDGYAMAFKDAGRKLAVEWGFLGELKATPKGIARREKPHMTTGVPHEEYFMPGMGALRKGYNAGMWAYKWVDSVNRRVSACAAYSAVKRLTPKLQRGEISYQEFMRDTGLAYMDPVVQADIMKPAESLFAKGVNRTAKAEVVEAMAKRAGRHIAEDTQWIYRPANSASILNSRVGRVLGQFGTWPSNYLQFLRRGVRSGDRIATQRFVSRWLLVNAALDLTGKAVGFDMTRMIWGGPLQFRGGPGLSLADAVYDTFAPYEWKQREGMRSLKRAGAIMIPGYMAFKDYIIDPLAAEDTAEAWMQVFGQRPREE